MNNSHPVADYMHPFFYQYLAGAKGVSSNTIISYRDTLKLFLCFGAQRLKKPVDRLNIEDLDDKMILINMVKLGLGHADINTTHIYVEIDMEMKQKILNTMRPSQSEKKKTKCLKWKNPDILKWLDELTNKSLK